MVHTHSLQGGWAGCGCQQLPAGGKPFCGSQLHRRRSTGSVKVSTRTQCSSTVANVKLPATHKEASQRALDQLRASSSIVNSESSPVLDSDAHTRPTLLLCICRIVRQPCWLSLAAVFCSFHCCAVITNSICLQGMLWRRKAAS